MMSDDRDMTAFDEGALDDRITDCASEASDFCTDDGTAELSADNPVKRLPAADLYQRLAAAGWRQFAVQRVSDSQIDAARTTDRADFFARKGLEGFLGGAVTTALGYAAATIAMPPLAVAGAGLAMLASAGFTLEKVMHIGQEIFAMRSDTPRYSPADADAHEYREKLIAKQGKQKAAAQQIRDALPQLASGDASADEAMIRAAKLRVLDINRDGLAQLLFEELDSRFREDIKNAQLNDDFDLAQSYAADYKSFKEKTSYGASSMNYYAITPTGMPIAVPMR